MNSPEQRWTRLAARARTASDARSTEAPYGFATRVAALAASAERFKGSLLERFSWRALGVACLLALVTTAVSYSVSTPSSDDDTLSNDSTVSALLDIT
ncbi:MAG: hypothetical protein JWM35_2521 [Verrucomicrobia bacterium]|nr:hypothetical protein [Verrucomicrobiota bacterium]